MSRFFRLFLAVALMFAGVAQGVALADITDSEASNLQEGENESSATQGGSADSGDAVGGQVTGIVSSGDSSVDARNRSEDADVESGEASGSNTSAGFTGLSSAQDTTIDASDVENSCNGGGCDNLQEGDNEFNLTQAITASSGDAVGGQVIGAVTSAGGSADIVAANTSEDIDAETGAANSENSDASFVGLITGRDTFIDAGAEATDIEDVCNGGGCFNLQEGDNDSTVGQSADSSSGDGVAGQVIGAVSAGDTSIDASNRSEDVDVETGTADAANDSAGIVGLNGTTRDTFIDVSDVELSCNGGGCDNLQEGDNDGALDQSATAASGDGVGGSVIGAVTSAGGSADIVAANDSEDVDIDTGDAATENDAARIIGLNTGRDVFVEAGAEASDIEDVCNGGGCFNLQEGDNDSTLDQNSDASSGDGVAGQVIGAVSAGDTSIDARNSSEDVDIATGDTDAANDSAGIVGLNGPSRDTFIDASDIELSCNGGGCDNLQEGDNEASLDQNASAASGDGVGGQVIGAVTAAGGSADIVADNGSEDVDVDTGDSSAENDATVFVGLNSGRDFFLEAGAELADIEDVCGGGGCFNLQEGDNELNGSQNSDASSGDGVAGQVIGAVSAGDASIDARNRSVDSDVETGEADANSDAAVFVGLNSARDTFLESGEAEIEDISGSGADNLQEGDNDSDFDQMSNASSGDAVAGQVAGVVTSAGGSADAVLDNVSEDIDAESGESTFDDEYSVFVGLNFGDGDLLVG